MSATSRLSSLCLTTVVCVCATAGLLKTVPTTPAPAKSLTSLSHA